MTTRVVSDYWRRTPAIGRGSTRLPEPDLPSHSALIDETTGARAYGNTPEEAEARAAEARRGGGTAHGGHPWRLPID